MRRFSRKSRKFPTQNILRKTANHKYRICSPGTKRYTIKIDFSNMEVTF